MTQYYEAIGRRKESTARVRLASGSGKFVVNEKEAPAFFTRLGDLQDILRAFAAVGQDFSKYDVTVKVKVDGEEVEVTLAELRNGYSRTSDYTRKAQALAEERKAFQFDNPG